MASRSLDDPDEWVPAERVRMRSVPRKVKICLLADPPAFGLLEVRLLKNSNEVLRKADRAKNKSRKPAEQPKGRSLLF